MRPLDAERNSRRVADARDRRTHDIEEADECAIELRDDRTTVSRMGHTFDLFGRFEDRHNVIGRCVKHEVRFAEYRSAQCNEILGVFRDGAAYRDAHACAPNDLTSQRVARMRAISGSVTARPIEHGLGRMFNPT